MMRHWALVATLATIPPGCESARPDPTPRAPPSAPAVIALPAPARDGGLTLAAALATRRSQRTFAARALTDAEVSQLLWAAQGLTADALRTSPSAGALYPLAVRLVDAQGVRRYVPAGHGLARERADDRRAALAAAGLGQAALATAPAIVAISAQVALTRRRYGARAERYATLEAGHAAQNLLLTATALGLGAVPIGAFADADVRRALDLADDETPLYLVPIGGPASP